MFISDKRILSVLIFACIALVSGCSEELDVHTRSMDRSYLVVEAMITDHADQPQRVVLTESIDYFEKEQPPVVSGAEVSVSDGTDVYHFIESPSGSGCYIGPEGFHGSPGNTYRLSVDAVVGGERNHYEATSKMEEPGFDVTAVDYMYMGKASMQADSLWSVAVWGQDKPEPSYYYVSAKLNDAVFPLGLSLVMDDKYFNGQKVVCFPITTLYQTAATRKQYGDCGKFLETGDVFTLNVYSVPKEYFTFYTGFISSSVGAAVPMLQSQPANCPTNITGGYAVGYFVACSSSSASVVIEDPFRPYYKKAFPFFPGKD
ncbi:MAG: DUF4249 domain-containing protein [Selenomonadaceae bacterium]|nr:DUF4249 domain-containing protein [Selenomonadaceae bacterium]